MPFLANLANHVCVDRMHDHSLAGLPGCLPTPATKGTSMIPGVVHYSSRMLAIEDTRRQLTLMALFRKLLNLRQDVRRFLKINIPRDPG